MKCLIFLCWIDNAMHSARLIYDCANSILSNVQLMRCRLRNWATHLSKCILWIAPTCAIHGMVVPVADRKFWVPLNQGPTIVVYHKSCSVVTKKPRRIHSFTSTPTWMELALFRSAISVTREAKSWSSQWVYGRMILLSEIKTSGFIKSTSRRWWMMVPGQIQTTSFWNCAPALLPLYQTVRLSITETIRVLSCATPKPII